ncbi:hypothetical protein BD410DRAFT_162479 [Rickenella mellea]|uniref:Uncharacterized protein n=1 Tax=Rickenella mellea TaxID=50990 RepID=A0A4Y7Q764_9AGAM|nr:hypothetical protein BD410DRAFT_162479 [Rickenella mellea]
MVTSASTNPSSSSSIPTLPQATYSLIPAPAATDGSFNTSIAALDPRIQYSGPQWGVTSTCNTTSKSCSDPAAFMLFQFTGTAIFMNLNMGLTGMIYSATLDGSSDIVNGFRPTDSCGTGWSRFGLSNVLHMLNITIISNSPQTPNSSLADAAVDFSGFIVTSKPNTTNSAGPSSSPTTSPTPTSSSSTLSLNLRLALLYACVAFAMMLLVKQMPL